jgi:exosortase A-associated hydrolase 2
VRPSRAGVLPFFLKSREGECLCLYHEPEPGQTPRGAILYVHPFAEELNKSRRMAALQARAYAQAGYAVLQIDLHGCGDSSGDFSDARWDIWLDDLARGRRWLLERSTGPFHLWGLRLGALLALDFSTRVPADALIFWQLAVSGRAHLNQFARMQSTARLFGELPQTTAHGAGKEIAGYMVASELSEAINHADAAALTPRCPVLWLELSAMQPPALQPASTLLVQRWRDDGVAVHTHALHGVPFWSSAEIAESPELLAATLAATLAPAMSRVTATSMPAERS